MWIYGWDRLTISEDLLAGLAVKSLGRKIILAFINPQDKVEKKITGHLHPWLVFRVPKFDKKPCTAVDLISTS